MSDIRLSVSASLDEDVSGLFKPIIPAAERYGALAGQAFSRGFQSTAGKGAAGVAGAGAPAGARPAPGGQSPEQQDRRRKTQQEKDEAAAAARKEKEAKKEAQRAEAEQNKKKRSEEQAQQYVARIRNRYFEQEQRREEKKERDDKAAANRRDQETRRLAQRQEAEAKRRSERQEAEAKRRSKAEERESEAAERRKATAAERARQYVARIKDRYFAQQQRDEEREERRKERKQARAAAIEERDARSFGQRTSYSAARTFERLTTSGVRYASDFARSAGVQLDLGSAVGRAVDLRKMASELSNSAFMPGAKGPNGQRVSSRELESLARDTGNMAGFDATETLGGLKDFVGKTGDLQTGRDLLKEMAVLAKATGTDLSDMISAAGDAANAIDETPGALAKGESKAQKIVGLMRTIAGQGKLGAVEISNLATQMAKLSASSSAFEGDQVANLADMGTLVQMARAKGGASSATSAATSVASFVGMIKTPARMREYEKATGQKIYNEDTGKFKSVEEIVLSSLEATGANPERLKKIFANVQGERAVAGFATTYRDAGGGKAGLDAVKAEFAKYRKIQMGEGEIKESFNRRMSDYDSQVTLFNNKISEIGASLAERLLPQLNALAPTVVKVVGSFGDLLSWAAQNPFRAIVSALGVSIMKAGIESVLRSGIETALKGAFSPGAAGSLSGVGAGGASGKSTPGLAGVGATPSAPGGAMGKALATAGAALAITATAVTIAEVGMLAIDKVFKTKEDAQAKAMELEIDAANKNAADKAAVRQAMVSPEEQRNQIKELWKQGRFAEAERVADDMASGKTAVSKDLYDRIAARKQDLDSRIASADEGILRKDDPFYAGYNQDGPMSSIARAIMPALSGSLSYITGGEKGTSFDAQAAREAQAGNKEALAAEQKRTNEILAGIKAAVEKGNLGMPAAPTAGTTAIAP
jgi:hypothetical protein